MDGQEAFEPAGPGSEPADPAVGPVGDEAAGPVPRGVVEGAGSRRPHWVAERCRRFAAAVGAAFRVVVAWCTGSSALRSDPAMTPPQPAGAVGAPATTPGRPTTPPDGRRLAREVRRLLAGLGPAPGDVAAALQASGVRGLPCRSERSPVAALLMAVVGADPDVEALGLRNDAVRISVRGYRSPLTVPFPAAVRDFLGAFDAQCYPMLLEQAKEHRPER